MGRRLQVSVIIPTYNRLEFLKEAVSSVFAQGYGDIELIVVDDGSTDGTEEWCINVDDERCKYIKIAHCGLPGRVRNIGIREAQGSLLRFLIPMISGIRGKSKSWDYERIPKLDVILLKMAIIELKEMPTIPVKVTLNEYIELAKYFSTPKSKTFINGVLDKLIIEMKASGQIKKEGRGLIE